MPNKAALLAALALAGCDAGIEIDTPALTPAAPLTAETDADGMPGLDLGLTGGRDASAHTEVAPGVFMLTELVGSDEISFVPQELEIAEDATGEELLEAIEADFEKQAATYGYSYCYNYDNFSYNERLSQNLFSERVTLYGYGNVYSYNYNNGQYAYNRVYSGAYAYGTAPVDYLYAYTYVYIEGRYVGYQYDNRTNGTYASTYGYWDARCDSDLNIDAEIYVQSYAYNTSDYTYASVGARRSLSARCCL